MAKNDFFFYLKNLIFYSVDTQLSFTYIDALSHKLKNIIHKFRKLDCEMYVSFYKIYLRFNQLNNIGLELRNFIRNILTLHT